LRRKEHGEGDYPVLGLGIDGFVDVRALVGGPY
jgi:hypothetical protein